MRYNTIQIQYSQLLVEASSSGLRTQTIQAYLNITVTRNENAPIYLELPYNDRIEDTIPLSESVFKVTATDADGVSQNIFRQKQNRAKSCFFLDLSSVKYFSKGSNWYFIFFIFCISSLFLDQPRHLRIWDISVIYMISSAIHCMN